MNILSIFPLCFLLVAAGTEPREARRVITKSLVLSNGLQWGSWGSVEYCEEGSFASDLEIKFEPYDLTDTDETALNAVKLYCTTPNMVPTGYVMSSEGSNGDWQGMRVCSRGFLTSMRAQVLQPRGVLLDDVAVQNVMMECNYGETIIMGMGEARIPEGDWSAWARCPNDSAICGIETRLEDPILVEDDTAITDISMFCCSLNDSTDRRRLRP